MINRDESELIAREQRNQRKPVASPQSRERQEATSQPHVVKAPKDFTAVPAEQSPSAKLSATSFRTLTANRTTRYTARD